jgi:Ca2+/Na+ antiporter
MIAAVLPAALAAAVSQHWSMVVWTLGLFARHRIDHWADHRAYGLRPFDGALARGRRHRGDLLVLVVGADWPDHIDATDVVPRRTRTPCRPPRYTLVTHRDAFSSDEPRDADKSWPIWISLLLLLTASAVIALEAELVSGALEATASALGLSTVFLGVIVLALIGTASDLFAASFFARQGKMGLALNICVGSAIQVALVVAPLLVLGSWVIGQPMTLVFDNPLNLFAIAGTALIVNAIASDGETTWFEGVLLIGVYALIGLAFFFSAPAG